MVLKIPEIKHMVSLALTKNLMSRRCKFVVKKKKKRKMIKFTTCVYFTSPQMKYLFSFSHT